MNVNQLYNRTITITTPNETNNLNENLLSNFNLVYYTYHGKLTTIADYFNKIKTKDIKTLLNNTIDNNNSSPLHIAGFLGYTNIFLYYLTFEAEINHVDNQKQNILHLMSYKGHSNLLSLMLNWIKFCNKLDCLKKVDSINKSYGFSRLDIIKGKLSKAVNLTETNVKSFNTLQMKLKQVANDLIDENLAKLSLLLLKDKEGRTPLHYAAMSKYSLCYLIINFICDYNFFSLDGWEDFLNVHNDIQDLEVKNDRFLDPRKCLRLEKELMNFLGENIISDLKKYFKNQKFKILQHVINTQDNMGDTVLHIAAFHGDYRIVSKLLSYGANKIERNLNNKIPVDLAKDNYVRKVLTNLNTAAKNSDSKNLTELVHFGHDINTKFSIFSQAPLHKVIESKKDDKYSVLRKMLDMGADTSIKDSNGWTALHYACEFNDIESVKILVSQNSNLDDYSNNKRTPLHLAANNGFAEIVRYILESKGSCNFKDHYGCIPLHLAAKQGHVDCIELLLSYGSDLTSEDFRKWNILHYASFHGHSHAVRFIVKYDADNNSLESLRNSQNKLPIEIVKNPLIKPYFISMWHAAKEGNLDMIRQLLNEGEEINEQTTLLRNTPLHLAVFNNHYLLVRLLLEHNADLESRNKDGVTPADYASVINDSIIKNAKNRISNIDIKNEYINLSSIVKNVYNKKEEVINSIISEKNRRVKLWKAIDFSNKIYKMISGGISET